MKKILFLTSIVAFSLMMSCKNEENKSTTTKEPSKNEAAVKAVYAAMESGDVSKIDSVIAPDAVDHNGGPMGKELRGRDNIKQMFTAMHGSVSNLKMEVKEMSSEGDYVFSWMHMTGTTSATPDPLTGMPANMKMDMTGVDVVKFNSNGQATDHWGYMDPNDMMKMMPPPPAAGNMPDTTKGKMGDKK
jgi:ketosteroid isomerase-like protein